MTTLPKIDRRGWLALWAQHRRRRRHHLLPAPVLRAAYPDLLQWDWELPNPFRWLVYVSLHDGTGWLHPDDYWMYGNARQFAPDGGSELHYIVGVDEFGNEVTERSNAVRPDDAPAPPTFHTNLAGYWKMDDPAGEPRYDSSGFEQHMVDWNGNFPSAAGLIGDAAFNYAEYEAKQLSADLYPFDSLARSASFWVYFIPGEYSNFQIYLNIDDGAWGEGAVAAYTNAGGEFNVLCFGTWVTIGYTNVTEEVWHHLAMTTDGTTSRCYLDGVEIANQESVPSSPSKLYVGNYYEMDRSIVGGIDEIGIWNRCLSPAEISSLYNNGDGLAYELF